MSTSRHPAYGIHAQADAALDKGRFRHDLTPAWFDLVDIEGAIAIVGSEARLNALRANQLIHAAEYDHDHGPRWYRGDLERFELVEVDDPMSGGRALVIGALVGIGGWLVALAGAVVVKVLGR